MCVVMHILIHYIRILYIYVYIYMPLFSLIKLNDQKGMGISAVLLRQGTLLHQCDLLWAQRHSHLDILILLEALMPKPFKSTWKYSFSPGSWKCWAWFNVYLLPTVPSSWIISICSITVRNLSTYIWECKFSPSGFHQALFILYNSLSTLFQA